MVYELLIPKWEKYNPRSDVKSSTWLRLSNDFFIDPDFYGTPMSMRMVYLFILCAASKKMNGGRCKVNTQMISDQLMIQEKEVKKHLTELLSMGFVQLVENHELSARSNPISNIMFPSATNERTDERTNERICSNRAALATAFEDWIKTYRSITAKNDGGTASAKKLIQARIKDGFTLEDCSLVVRHKHDQWRNDDKMRQFIRPATLFSGKFETYLDEAKNSGAVSRSTLEDRARRARIAVDALMRDNPNLSEGEAEKLFYGGLNA